MTHHGIKFIMCVLCTFMTCCGIASAADAILRITSPVLDSRVKGPITFTVDAKRVPAGAAVEWRLNGVPLDGPICVPPYSYEWHSAMVWDGPAAVQAVALDAAGKVVAASERVPFYVDNFGGVAKLVSPDPAGLAKGEKLSGTIDWTVSFDRPTTPEEEKEMHEKAGGRKPIEATMFFIDGRDWKIAWGRSTATQKLDTTTLPNGRHVLMNTAWPWPKVNPCVGWVQFEVTIDNGRAPMAIRPRKSLMVFQKTPEDQLMYVAPSTVFTDGSSELLKEGVTYTSADPAVATVDERGRVRPVGIGTTTIALEANGMKASTRVIVMEPRGLPHFSRSGKVLTKYEPGQSMWVRSLFGFGPREIAKDVSLVQQARAAAINTLTTGFYLNPADGSNPPDLEAFRKNYDRWWAPIEAPAREHDFSLLLTGDDICRTPNEMNNSVNNPWSAQAVQYAFTKLRDSGRAICVEMVDEISFLWGVTPTPNDGRWQKKNPPLSDDAFLRLMATINGVKDRPPITWPIGGISSDEAAKNWMGNPAFSDYATIYWDTFAWRKAYQWGMSLPQMKDALDRATLGRYRVIQRDKPMLLLMSICGPMLSSTGIEKQFVETPLHYRRLLDSGGSAISETAQVMYAAARGYAGVRAYNFDNELWKRERAGTRGERQTGSDPYETGTNRWAGLSAAFNLVQHLEPHLLQEQVGALDLGPDIVTGSYGGYGGTLVIALNMAEVPVQVSVPISRYSGRRTAPVVRYRIVGATMRTDLAPKTSNDPVTFAPGEAIVWLTRPADDPKVDITPPTAAITAPLPDSTVAGEVELKAVAHDDAGIRSVEFFIDGLRAGKAEKAPYAVRCNTAGLKPGTWHRVSAVASDDTGNTSEARIMLRVAEAGP